MEKTIRAEHIGIGSEILLGQITNSHARTVSLEFANHGYFVYHHTAVGDNFNRIIDAFKVARTRSSVIVVTGGLGPTNDDLTKEALATFLNRPLEMSESALRRLEAWFSNRNVLMPQENRKQALCISGGELIENPNGTAPGVYVEDDSIHYFLLPGPPLEMLPMLLNHVIPKLNKIFGNESTLVSRVLHLCGIGESAVDEQITDLTAMANPTVAPLAGEGEMLLRITAVAGSVDAAKKLIQPAEESLRSRFGRFIYGVDDETLPSVVGNALLRRDATLAVAETCTGGTISSMLTAISGSSQYFYGSVIAYDNDIKQAILGVKATTLLENGAVSEEAAREMAEGVRQRFGTTFGLAVTGIAGPTGATPEKPIGLCFGAISSDVGTVSFRLHMSGSREQIRLRTSKHMLYRLWTVLCNHGFETSLHSSPLMRN